ncbi:hypothetical protein EDD28_1184 [Salana multivorans]|uniref:NPCBM/NEW2 domain-containing protein n=1 Tax=Salana multivorans TaxID=120377 RepID=A0A3N2D9X2_9MICO|nr:hypothetical protein [Salana multivorans]ROR96599.1 hypothetical protein EDD28_1184 [Salana multivorans]
MRLTNRTSRHLALLSLPLAAALALTSCSAAVEGGDQSPSETSAAPDPASSPSSDAATPTDAAETPSATPEESSTAGAVGDTGDTGDTVTLPDGATWLSDVPSVSGRESGAVVDVTVRGVAPTHATGQFLGCDGTTDVVQYDLGGAYATFDGRLAMRDGVPDGLVAEVVILTDGEAVSAYRVDATDDGVPFRILADGVDVLEVQTTAVEGECQTDAVPYLVFVDSYLTR